MMKGYYTSYGTKIFKNISSEDAISISRLKAAGAIIVGKTTMHELGLGTSGVSLPFGTPRNPYDIKKYSGGSSSGSAVAVASGYVLIYSLFINIFEKLILFFVFVCEFFNLVLFQFLLAPMEEAVYESLQA